MYSEGSDTSLGMKQAACWEEMGSKLKKNKVVLKHFGSTLVGRIFFLFDYLGKMFFGVKSEGCISNCYS